MSGLLHTLTKSEQVLYVHTICINLIQDFNCCFFTFLGCQFSINVFFFLNCGTGLKLNFLSCHNSFKHKFALCLNVSCFLFLGLGNAQNKIDVLNVLECNGNFIFFLKGSGLFYFSGVVEL